MNVKTLNRRKSRSNYIAVGNTCAQILQQGLRNYQRRHVRPVIFGPPVQDWENEKKCMNFQQIDGNEDGSAGNDKLPRVYAAEEVLSQRTVCHGQNILAK